MSFADKIGQAFSRKGLIIIAGIVLFYCLWIYGLSTNPPGFFIDESCIAYNGYLIATTGAQEDGTKFPLYIHCYTQGWSQYMSAGQPYALALLYLFISPSPLSARIFAATLVYISILLLGFLAARISGRTSVGIIVALSGMATPWLFEYSRLVMETFVLILSITLFLVCLYRASLRERWKITDVLSVSLLLTLITYSYATGRVIGPLFTFGLLIFAVNLRKLVDVFKVWVVYSLTMIPMIVVYFKDPLIISGRFLRATNLSKDASLFENISKVVAALWEDFSLKFFIFEGDHLLRHHIPDSGMGEFLVATFVLGIIGVVIVLIKHRSSTWWRFILYGAFASMLPGAITFERQHSMRALAFPIFFMLFTVPAISWLMGLYDKKEDQTVSENDSKKGFWTPTTKRYFRLATLGVLLLLTAVQGIQFQSLFRVNGLVEARKGVFHEAYSRVLDQALAMEDRPIYLHDSGEPVYMNALWLGISKGYDKSNFVHLLDRQNPPEGAIVISSKTTCTDCQVLYLDGGFLLYRNQKPDASSFLTPVPADTSLSLSVFSAGPGSEPGQLSRPRGLATDSKGNLYVADSGNGRIQKFDADGKFVIQFGNNGPADTNLKDPNGVAVDAAGNVYVVDVGIHRLIKFNSEGIYETAYDGAGTGFYGPRDLAIGSNNRIYVVDQGRERIAVFDPETKQYPTVWGAKGTAQSDFGGPTGIAVSKTEVYVADQGNGRIQVFDLNGTFLRQWEVPSWSKAADETPDIAFDENTQILYASSCKANRILAFDANGTPMADLTLPDPEMLNDPGAMVITEANGKRSLNVVNRATSTVVRFELAAPKDPKKKK